MNGPLIDFKNALNEEQHAAVTAEPGPALVLAGAGSGKTRTLTYRVAWLLLEREIQPDQLLLLTFTNKAAREMIERVQSLTGLGRSPRWAGTFHSIGGRVLRQYGSYIGLAPGYTIMDQPDAESMLSGIIKESDKAFLKNKENPRPKVIHSLLSYARNTRQDFEELFRERYPWHDGIARQVTVFVTLYDTAKREQQVVDYDDLLVLWLRLLNEFPDVREGLQRHFPYILVDEYQDTNIIQADIIDAIGAHHNIMAVGDDAQCIYTWRGALFENIRSFPERHPGTRIYKILTNYRSTPPILRLANDVLARQPGEAGYRKKLVAFREGSTRPYLVPIMDTRQQAQFLISRIEALYEEGVALSEIAILYRAHYQALDAQLEFTRRGIPFIITSGIRFFEQAHVKDFVAQMRILANPEDSPAFERVLCLLPRVGPATVRKIGDAARKVLRRQRESSPLAPDLFRGDLQAEPDFFTALATDEVRNKVPADAREDYRSLIATFIEVHPRMNSGGEEKPSDIVQHVLDGWYGDYIRNVYPDWENRQDDLLSIVTFAARFETMAELLAQLVLMNSETSDKHIEPEDDNAVRMTTIHQAKGLEFPVVFLISCADEWLPLRRAIEEGDVEEERRLFYVGITRAMNELYLSFPMMHAQRGGGVQRLLPSRFIGEIPDQAYEKLSFRSAW